MDKSKEYVEMCRKAKEIQESWVAEVGDFWTYGGACSEVSMMCYDECFGVQKEEGQIWLPRQDQLQEMILSLERFVNVELWSLKEQFDTSLRVLLKIVKDFNDFTWGGEVNGGQLRNIRSGIVTSMEQLWLAFIMKENNKIWNGKEWTQ